MWATGHCWARIEGGAEDSRWSTRLPDGGGARAAPPGPQGPSGGPREAGPPSAGPAGAARSGPPGRRFHQANRPGRRKTVLYLSRVYSNPLDSPALLPRLGADTSAVGRSGAPLARRRRRRRPPALRAARPPARRDCVLGRGRGRLSVRRRGRRGRGPGSRRVRRPDPASFRRRAGAARTPTPADGHKKVKGAIEARRKSSTPLTRLRSRPRDLRERRASRDGPPSGAAPSSPVSPPHSGRVGCLGRVFSGTVVCRWDLRIFFLGVKTFGTRG